MKPVRIGRHGRRPVHLDPQRLVDTRLLACANSGGGKSYFARVLAERVAPSLQIIVIDPEGEFGTLREEIDAVLVGPGGDLEAHPRAAALLARKVMELGTHVIIDLSELGRPEQRRFVRLFCEALIALPKKLWHPVMLALDEAHDFAPEKGQSESLSAVTSVASRGRKRGIGLVLLTQRLSKLHKDAAAECRNLMIGLTNFDVDLKRAVDLLGMGKADWPTLQGLGEGEFFTSGPAFDVTGVERVQIDTCRTTHPKSGERYRMEPPKPSSKIRNVLPEFEGLPERAAEEARTLGDAKLEIADLRKRLRKSERSSANGAAPVSKSELHVLRRQAESDHKKLRRHYTDRLAVIRGKIQSLRRPVLIEALAPMLEEIEHFTKDEAPPVREPDPVASEKSPVPAGTIGRGGKRNILVALAQHPDGLSRTALAMRAGLAPAGGTYAKYLGILRSAGLAEGSDPIRATGAGLAELGEWDPLPEGPELVRYWIGQVSGGQRRILQALVGAGSEGLDRDALAAAAELTSSAGTFAKYLGRLRRMELVDEGHPIRAHATLLESAHG